MNVYKIFRVTEQGLRSINKSPELDVIYEKGEKTYGIDDTPLFVFGGIGDTKSFLKLYSQHRRGDFEIWEVEAGGDIHRMSYVPVVGSRFTKEMGKRFWDQYYGLEPYDTSFEFCPAFGAYVCDWVIPLKRIEKWDSE